MALYYACLVAGVLFGIAGQVALKSGAEASTTIISQFLHPLTIIGFGIYVFAAFCYIIALKRIPISVAFPSVSMSYAIIAILAHFLWNEPFGWQQIGGILLIGSGILLIHQH